MSAAQSVAAARPAPMPTTVPMTVPIPAAEIMEIVSEAIEAGRLDRAERLVGHVIAAYPANAEALHVRGLIAARRKRHAEAATWMERGIAAGGRRAAQLRNLSEIYRVLGRLDEALALARQAIAADPADAAGPFNLAMIHYDRMEIDPCIRAARHALQLKKSLPAPHMKLAQALLIKGDFSEGWDEYEWRYQIPGAQPLMPPTDRPQWDGTPLGDKRLLLIGDQGYGDVIMFARYVPWAVERCPNTVIACSAEMMPTLRRMFPQVPLFSNWAEIGAFEAYCPLSGLPRRHGTRLETIPASVPYLSADPDRLAIWGRKLNAKVPPGLKRIGIAWAGRPTHNNDHNRTTTLSTFAPLGEVPGIALVSLQKGDAAAQVKDWTGAAPLIDIAGQIETFEDTMAVIEHLDLCVIVDTSIGHFAGAMNRPAWVMLPFAPDWRWLMGRGDTPWYPSLRLFRAPQTKRWDALVAEVAGELRKVVVE